LPPQQAPAWRQWRAVPDQWQAVAASGYHLRQPPPSKHYRRQPHPGEAVLACLCLGTAHLCLSLLAPRKVHRCHLDGYPTRPNPRRYPFRSTPHEGQHLLDLGARVGVDLGLNSLVALSDGTPIEAPKNFGSRRLS
jgi:hypothetical protein